MRAINYLSVMYTQLMRPAYHVDISPEVASQTMPQHLHLPPCLHEWVRCALQYRIVNNLR